ncbi:daunorubicin resistance protein DrrA family ABC transporter ATP-binding protein [Methanoregula formicica]|uniref:Daunorubicin resistance ABC transporter ATP-binding subunit n=1 Tax=Methanoregula formicica (strain DSM 22288 / NBRC 105244 / SMSP) TaxID=593750 RepID=L0HD38_METFS|nr:daunorubicin resistance protein DrrA family ABC transporter ATP-binding protein [Methanoregula formicica]AGB01945.1 daunorubicin resistance ABC transporter ATP-binding subunit [Methanoregula formicica SMSP]
MDAIVLDNLTRSFGSLTAVDAVSLTVQEGELFGLLGPNGAGKTTIINILTTLDKPSHGTATISGHSIHTDPDKIRRMIGIVFQDPSLDIELTGRENLDFHAMMYDMPSAEREQRIREVLALVDLQDRADQVVREYSGGMRRRLEIARGLMHRPRILFLDEPTLGLDAQTRRKIWHYIRELNHSLGITLILTTHYLEEADFLCDRIAIIDHGKIIALDTPENLKIKAGEDFVCIESDTKNIETIKTLLREYGETTSINSCDHAVTISMTHAEKKIPSILGHIFSKGISVSSVTVTKPSLEEAFLAYTGSAIRDQKGSSRDQVRAYIRRNTR